MSRKVQALMKPYVRDELQARVALEPPLKCDQEGGSPTDKRYTFLMDIVEDCFVLSPEEIKSIVLDALQQAKGKFA